MAEGHRESGRLHVALVAPPYLRVPPVAYGGTELVIAELARGLARLGHHVTLFASGDSRVEGCETRWLFPAPLWPPDRSSERNHATFAVREILAGPFDLVHAHSPALLPLAARLGTPVVYTVHHGRDPSLARLYAEAPQPHYVCISARHARVLEDALPSSPSVVHHGLDPDAYRVGEGRGGFALFLGRLDAVKAPHLACVAAREARIPLHVAGKPHEGDYFPRVLAPELARGGARLVGELGGESKLRALADARVLVFPSTWEEPFGLALIEAMLSGTPVVALRRGAVPELVDEGVTGYVADEPEELAPLLRAAAGLDRRAVRARAVARFSAARMTRDYVEVYARVLWDRAAARQSWMNAP